MKNRRAMALMLGSAMVATSLAGCVQTKTQQSAAASQPAATQAQAQNGNAAAPAAPAVKRDPINLKLLYNSSDESVANVVRDELTKAGFGIEMAAQPDGASFREQEKNGNFDISLASWANPVGTPDYGCRGIWESTGDSNLLGINDSHLDELVNKAATETADVYVKTYGEAEKYVVDEQCFMFPLYVGRTGRGFSKVLDPEHITNNQRWENLKYVDESQTETRPVVLTQTGSTFFTWDPIRVDDQASGYSLDEMYIHLLTLQPDWGVSVDQSLSYSYAIAEDNANYYFLLRDDCGFARVDKDGNVYDSGVKVAGEDVVYSLKRAMDKDSTALHACYSMFKSVADVVVVEDAAELDSVKTASGKTVAETLKEGGNYSEIVTSRDDVDNDAGKYQVVKVTTSVPYPQILNALTFHGAGIVDSQFVEEYNKGVDYSKYDATKDKLYGDDSCVKEGADFNNHLSLSGNYVLASRNDYQLNFVANPAIRTRDTEHKSIKTLTLKLIADKDAALSALRSGEVDFPYSLPATKYELVEKDENLAISYMPAIRAYVVAFNMHGNSEVSKSADLRKAIASCINFEDIKAVLAGNAIPSSSPLSTCLDTGNSFTFEGRTQEFLDAYYASK